MKYILWKRGIIVAGTLISLNATMGLAQADSITYPAPALFVDGQTLTATSLNGKFTEAQRAVNDNDVKLKNIHSRHTGAGRYPWPRLAHDRY